MYVVYAAVKSTRPVKCVCTGVDNAFGEPLAKNCVHSMDDSTLIFTSLHLVTGSVEPNSQLLLRACSVHCIGWNSTVELNLQLQSPTLSHTRHHAK